MFTGFSFYKVVSTLLSANSATSIYFIKYIFACQGKLPWAWYFFDYN
ncbi:hypothetical protein RAMDARK_1920 [Rickettsia amblyommatis str. Darkwater]|nr:hypothetical protein RAMDARK_1920 [Rickettsia amblyommatis str. Darkwater]